MLLLPFIVRLVGFWPQIRTPGPPYDMEGGTEKREGGRQREKVRERKLGLSAFGSLKAVLLPHSTGYQGINRVLKALRGGRNGGFLENGKGRDSE